MNAVEIFHYTSRICLERKNHEKLILGCELTILEMEPSVS
jgi:hypothetical protein